MPQQRSVFAGSYPLMLQGYDVVSIGRSRLKFPRSARICATVVSDKRRNATFLSILQQKFFSSYFSYPFSQYFRRRLYSFSSEADGREIHCIYKIIWWGFYSSKKDETFGPIPPLEWPTNPIMLHPDIQIPLNQKSMSVSTTIKGTASHLPNIMTDCPLLRGCTELSSSRRTDTQNLIRQLQTRLAFPR